MEILTNAKTFDEREERILKRETGNQFYEIIKLFVKKEPLCSHKRPKIPDKLEVWKKSFLIILKLEKIARTLTDPPIDLELFLDSLPNLQEFEITDGKIDFLPKTSSILGSTFVISQESAEICLDKGLFNRKPFQENNLKLCPCSELNMNDLKMTDLNLRFRYGRQKKLEKKSKNNLQDSEICKKIMDNANLSGFSFFFDHVEQCVEILNRDASFTYSLEKRKANFVELKFYSLVNELKKFEIELGQKLVQLNNKICEILENAKHLRVFLNPYTIYHCIWNVTQFTHRYWKENFSQKFWHIIEKFRFDSELLLGIGNIATLTELTEFAESFKTGSTQSNQNYRSMSYLGTSLMEEIMAQWTCFLDEICEYLAEKNKVNHVKDVLEFKQKLRNLRDETMQIYDCHQRIQSELNYFSNSIIDFLQTLIIQESEKKDNWSVMLNNLMKLTQFHLQILELNTVRESNYKGKYDNNFECYSKNLKNLIAQSLEQYMIETLRNVESCAVRFNEAEFVNEFSDMLKPVVEDIYLNDLEKINKMSTLELSDQDGVLLENEFSDEERRLFEYMSNALNNQNFEEKEHIRLFGVPPIDVKSIDWIVHQRNDKKIGFRRVITNAENQSYFLGDTYDIDDLKKQLVNSLTLSKNKLTLYEGLKLLNINDTKQNKFQFSSIKQEPVRNTDESLIDSLADDIFSLLDSQNDKISIDLLNENVVMEYYDEDFDEIMISLDEFIETTGKSEERVKKDLIFEMNQKFVNDAFDNQGLFDGGRVIALETEVQINDTDCEMEEDKLSNLEIIDIDMQDCNTDHESVTSRICSDTQRMKRKQANYMLVLSDTINNLENSSIEYVSNLMEYVKDEYGDLVFDYLIFLHVLGLKLPSFMSYIESPETQKHVRIFVSEFMDNNIFHIKLSNNEEQGLYFIQGCSKSKNVFEKVEEESSTNFCRSGMNINVI